MEGIHKEGKGDTTAAFICYHAHFSAVSDALFYLKCSIYVEPGKPRPYKKF